MSVQRRIAIDYADGRCGILVIGETGGGLPFHATVVTEKSVAQYKADNALLYRVPYCSRFFRTSRAKRIIRC